MKKFFLIIILFALLTTSLFAAPLRFVFGDLGQHPEILMGFLPSYFMSGAGYQLPSLIENRRTEIQFLLGFGYNQRKLWKNQLNGNPIDSNPLIYDVIQTDWSLRFAQGFLESPVAGKDLFTLTFSYDGKYEVAKDSIVSGKIRYNGGDWPVNDLKTWLAADSDAYPELKGNAQHLGTGLGISLKLDIMNDLMTTTDGFVLKADAKYSPLVLNSLLDGIADYYTFNLNMVAAKTLFQLQDANKDIFTIVIIDRANVGYLDGAYVPAYQSGGFSLGRKIRGFNSWTYDTQFTAINNLDLRIAGPNMGVKGIFPRINMFYDIGYGSGRYFNSALSGENFLMSTGFQATVSFFDFIDLGYQIAYLIKGNNFTTPGTSVIGSFTFFLDF